jgi:hypothetical protein
MKVANPNLVMWLNCWRHGVLRVLTKLFFGLFLFWFVLLFCKLLQGDLGELVLVMECDFRSSMKTFHELCESWLFKGIGMEIFGERSDEEWRSIYDDG